VQAFHLTLGGNVHVVIAREVYRSGQPTAAGLEALIRRYGIRTVVNLRGENAGFDWYGEEKQTTARLGVGMVDVGLYGNVPAEADQLRLLVETLDHAPRPILVHCNSGGDRAGLASTLALLLRTEADLPEARGQMAWWLGHNPFGHAACHDRLFDLYAEWLGQARRAHTPDLLRKWVREVYRQEDCNLPSMCRR
jgi:protein tyrosine/serine phosphatase